MQTRPDFDPARGIRRLATKALRDGRLHPDAWAAVDELVLDPDLLRAARLLRQHLQPFATFPLTPGPRELGQQRPPMPGLRLTAPTSQEHLA